MSLEDVARVTKIQPRILERLEAGKFDGLPADVFVRGFVRSIARCVGLTEAEALSRYEACGAATAGTSPTVVPTTARAFVESMSELAPHTARAAASSPQMLRSDGMRTTGSIEIVDIAADAADVDDAPLAQGSLRLAAMPALAVGTSESEIVAEPVVALAPIEPTAQPAEPMEPAPPIVAAAVEAVDAAPAKKKRTRKPRATTTVPTTTAAANATPAPAPRRRRKAVATVSPVVVVPAEAAETSATTVEMSASSSPAIEVVAEPVAPVVETLETSATGTVDAAPAPLVEPASDAVPTEIVEIDLWAVPPLASASSTMPLAIDIDREGAPNTSGTWTPRMPAVVPAAPWRRPSLAHSLPVVPTLVIDDADPARAERELEDRHAERTSSRRSFLPPILLDREDRSGRQGGLTLAVIILLIAATLTLSYLMRRPGTSGDGMTARDVPTLPIA